MKPTDKKPMMKPQIPKKPAAIMSSEQEDFAMPTAKFEGAEKAKVVQAPKESNKMQELLKSLSAPAAAKPSAAPMPEPRTPIEKFKSSNVDAAQFGKVDTIKPMDDDYAMRLKVLKELMGVE